METTEVVNHVVQDHRIIHARLAEWEAALRQLTASAFSESQRGLQRVWRLVPFFEKEVSRHFRDEETRLFPAVTTQNPDSQKALARFAGEHNEFSRQWQAFKRELLYCDAEGETRRVCELGTGLICLLRRHMRDEEQELLPLVGKS